MPLFHVHGLVASTLSTLLSGGTVVVPGKFNPLSFWRTVRDTGAGFADAPGQGLGLENVRARLAALLKYSADQPRVPAGQPGGGQFGEGGGGPGEWKDPGERPPYGNAPDGASDDEKMRIWGEARDKQIRWAAEVFRSMWLGQ